MLWRFCAQATLADSFLADLEDLSDDENHDEVWFWMLCQPLQARHCGSKTPKVEALKICIILCICFANLVLIVVFFVKIVQHVDSPGS